MLPYGGHVLIVLPYGGHDCDGEEEGVGKCPLVAPTLHLFRGTFLDLYISVKFFGVRTLQLVAYMLSIAFINDNESTIN